MSCCCKLNAYNLLRARGVNMQLQTVCNDNARSKTATSRQQVLRTLRLTLQAYKCCILQTAAACRAGKLRLLPIAHANRRHIEDCRRLPLQTVSYSVAFCHVVGKCPHLHCRGQGSQRPRRDARPLSRSVTGSPHRSSAPDGDGHACLHPQCAVQHQRCQLQVLPA